MLHDSSPKHERENGHARHGRKMSGVGKGFATNAFSGLTNSYDRRKGVNYGVSFPMTPRMYNTVEPTSDMMTLFVNSRHYVAISKATLMAWHAKSVFLVSYMYGLSLDFPLDGDGGNRTSGEDNAWLNSELISATFFPFLSLCRNKVTRF